MKSEHASGGLSCNKIVGKIKDGGWIKLKWKREVRCRFEYALSNTDGFKSQVHLRVTNFLCLGWVRISDMAIFVFHPNPNF